MSGPFYRTRHAHSWETSSSGQVHHRDEWGTENANACRRADDIYPVVGACVGEVAAYGKNHYTREWGSPPDAGIGASVNANGSGKMSEGARARARFVGGRAESASGYGRAFVGGARRIARL